MRIYTDGAEMGDVLFWDVPGNVTNSNATTVTARSGNRCYQVSNSACAKTVPAKSEYYFRVGLRIQALEASTHVMWRNGGNTLGQIKINSSTGKIELYTGPSLLLAATGITTISINQWYLLEFHVLIDSSVGIVQIKVDGTMDINFSGDTQPAALSTIDNIAHVRSTANFFVDDLACNDTTGPVDNNWCGDGRIVISLPKVNGSNIQLTRGGTDKGANWKQVQETPHDSDTTYVESLTSGFYDLYYLTTPSGLAANEVITRIYVESRVKETTAAGDPINMGISPSGTSYWALPQSTTTNYARYVTSGWLVNPDNNQPWTVTSVSGLQIGFRIV